MNAKIEPGDLANYKEWGELVALIDERSVAQPTFQIDLTHTSQINLAQFNAMVALYAKLRRKGAWICYENFNDSVRKFVEKTNFHHVFKG